MAWGEGSSASRGGGSFGGGGGTRGAGVGRGTGGFGGGDNRKDRESQQASMKAAEDREAKAKADRQAAEKARQASWRAKNESRVTNEYRRGPDGSFQRTTTDYGKGRGEAGRSYEGHVQHGRISDSAGVRSYTGNWTDKDFGRDVGRYGRVQSSAMAESYMKASEANLAADRAWQDGRYGDYIRAKAQAAIGFGEVSLKNNIADFQNAPLDYASALLDNPLVSGAVLASGLGIPAFGVKVADAVADYVQGESTPEQSLRSAAGSLISHTPVGAVFGPMRSVASAFASSTEEGAIAASGMLGGKVGGILGGSLAGNLSNPLAAAGVTAVSAAVGSSLAKQQTQKAIANGVTGGTPTETPMRQPSGSQREPTVSPLVASGEMAVAKQEALQQPAKVDLYAQTVKEMPYYGLNVDDINMPYYGV